MRRIRVFRGERRRVTCYICIVAQGMENRKLIFRDSGFLFEKRIVFYAHQ